MICPMKFNQHTLDLRVPDAATDTACELDHCAWWDTYAEACAIKSLGLLRYIEDLTIILGYVRNELDQLNRIQAAE